MADISVTAAEVGRVFPDRDEVYDFIAAEAITKGAPVFFDATTGQVELADANVADEQQFRGIAVTEAAAGQAITILKRGCVYGFDLSGMSYDDLAYLSDTVGRISTTVGTLTVNVGRVVALADHDATKVLYVDADWLREWS